MAKTTERLPYRAPQVTRVVLKREQAILSQCTLAWTTMQASALVTCRTRNGCRGGSGTKNGDFAGALS